MKRKIALALAAVMAAAMIVPMNLFASTTARVSGQYLTRYQAGLLYPDGSLQLGPFTKLQVGNPTDPKANNVIDYGVYTKNSSNNVSNTLNNNGIGSSLQVQFQTDDFKIADPRAFRVTLVSGGTWAFYNAGYGNGAVMPTASIFSGTYQDGVTQIPSTGVSATYGNELIGTSEPATSYADSSLPYRASFAPFYCAQVYGQWYDAQNGGVGGGNSSGFSQSLITDDLYNNTLAAIYSAAAAADGDSAVSAASRQMQNVIKTNTATYINAGNDYLTAFLMATADAVNSYGKTLNDQYAIINNLTYNDIWVVFYDLFGGAANLETVAANVAAGKMTGKVGMDASVSMPNASQNGAAMIQGANIEGSLYTDPTSGYTVAQTMLTKINAIQVDATTVVADFVGVAGNYYTTVLGAGSTYATEYMLQYTPDSTGATQVVTYYGYTSSTSSILIPAVAVSDGTAMKISITDIGANNVSSTPTPVDFTGATTGVGVKVNASINTSGNTNGKYQLNLGAVTLTEAQINALVRTGGFYIDAPLGYHFVGVPQDGKVYTANSGSSPISTSTNMYPFTSVQLLYEGGFSLISTVDGSHVDCAGLVNTAGTAPSTAKIVDASGNPVPAVVWDPNTNAYEVIAAVQYIQIGGSAGTSYNPLTAPESNAANNLYSSTQVGPSSRIYFQVNNINQVAITLAGSFSINGLAIAPNDPSNTAYNDPTLTIHIADSNGTVYGTDANGSLYLNVNGDGTYNWSNSGVGANIVAADLQVGQRLNWSLNYSVTSQFYNPDGSKIALGTPANCWSGWSNMGDMTGLASGTAARPVVPTNLAKLSNSAYTTTTAIQVTLAELVAESWWTDHNTTFALTDASGNPISGVMFSNISVGTNNLANNISYSSAQSTTGNAGYNTSGAVTAGSFLDRYNTSSHPTLSFNVAGYGADTAFTIVNQNRVNATNTASAVLTFTLSAQADFSGPVYLTVLNDGLNQANDPSLYGVNQPNSTNPVTTISNLGSTQGTTPLSVEVANFTPVVSFTTTTSSVQIGYQSFGVSDIKISEAAPGLIQTGTLDLALGEYGNGNYTPYMYFGQISSANLNVDTASGLVVSNFGIISTNNSTTTSNALGLTISKSSSAAAAVINLTNLIVNISRDVPQGYYNLIIGGNAVTNNSASDKAYQTRINNISSPSYTFDLSQNLDVFNVAGQVWVDPTKAATDPSNKSYITVATQGSNIPFTANVTIPLGSDTATVLSGGISQQVSLNQSGFAPCPAVLDANNNMMVPVRFVSVALGVDPMNIYWDQDSQTCTIYTTEKTFTFKVNSSTATINGNPFTLIGADGNPVAPQLENAADGTARMYLPVRALAHAFGLAVTYDPATNTAYINPTDDQINQFGADSTYGAPATDTSVADTSSTDNSDSSDSSDVVQQ